MSRRTGRRRVNRLLLALVLLLLVLATVGLIGASPIALRLFQGATGEWERLSFIANEMFQGQVGRSYWQAAREARLSTSGSRMERRFHEILDEEYRKSAPSVRQEPLRPSVHGSPGRIPMRQRILWAGIGAGTLALSCHLLRSARRLPPGR